MGAVLAKIFAIRICLGSLGTNRRLATRVRAVRPAIAGGTGGSVQCAEVAQVADAIPKKSVLGPPLVRFENPATQPALFISKAVLFVPAPPNVPRSVTV